MGAYDKVLLAGAIESTFRGGGTPNLNQDVFDVANFNLTPNFERVERAVHRASFSPPPTRVGRKTQNMTFQMELNGSGVTNGSRPPQYDALLRACGFARTAFTAPALALARAHPENSRIAPVTLAGAATGYTGTMSRLVSVTMTSPTVATVFAHETPNGDPVFQNTAVTITSGTSIPGPQGATMTMTFTGALVAGDRYLFWFVPPGHLYSPASDPDTAESVYFHAYLDNKRHTMVGSYGSVSFQATAGELAIADFNFLGDWALPTDAVFPSAFSYGGFPLPPIVELADLSLDNVLIACPTTFAFDVSNSLAARACINAPGGANGAKITDRTPTASFNMDSVPVAAMNIWGMLDTSQQLQLTGYVGTKPGNFVQFFANGQLGGTGYANLDGLRKNDNTMTLNGLAGNDELLIFVS